MGWWDPDATGATSVSNESSGTENSLVSDRGNIPKKCFSRKVFAELFSKSDRSPPLRPQATVLLYTEFHKSVTPWESKGEGRIVSVFCDIDFGIAAVVFKQIEIVIFLAKREYDGVGFAFKRRRYFGKV